jgi:hypothetical protein
MVASVEIPTLWSAVTFAAQWGGNVTAPGKMTEKGWIGEAP